LLQQVACVLVGLSALGVRDADGSASALHWTHCKLRKVVSICIASALIQIHVHHLVLLLSRAASTIVSCTSFHLSGGIARDVCIMRKSASELALIATSSGLALIIRSFTVLGLLIVQNLNILIIIIIIWLLSLSREATNSDAHCAHHVALAHR
jgi:hypothetical protein